MSYEKGKKFVKYVREIFPLERWLCKAKGVRGMFFCKITNRQNEIGIV